MSRARIDLSRATVAVALGMILFAIGCKTSSKWQFVTEAPGGKATTTLTVRTEPKGAEININGTFIGESPVEVPVRYPYRVKIYQRRQYLPLLHVEEKELRVYQKNDFTVGAYAIGYFAGKQEITLTGQETKEVVIRLRKKPE